MAGNLGKAGPGQPCAGDHTVVTAGRARLSSHGQRVAAALTVPRHAAASRVTPGVTSYCCGTELEKPLALGWKINDVEGRVTGLIPSFCCLCFLPFLKRSPPSCSPSCCARLRPSLSLWETCSGLQLKFMNFAQALQRGDCLSFKETAFPPVTATGWERGVLYFNLASAFESWTLL